MSDNGSFIFENEDTKSKFDHLNPILKELIHRSFDTEFCTNETRQRILNATLEKFAGQEIQNKPFLCYLSQISLALLASLWKNQLLPSFLKVDSTATEIFSENFTIHEIKTWVIQNIYFLASKKILFQEGSDFSNSKNDYSASTLSTITQFCNQLFQNCPEDHLFARQVYALWYALSANLQTVPESTRISASPYRLENMTLHGAMISRAASTKEYISIISPNNEKLSSLLKNIDDPLDKYSDEIFAYQYLQYIFGHFLANPRSFSEKKEKEETQKISIQLMTLHDEYLKSIKSSKAQKIIKEFLAKEMNDSKLMGLSIEEQRNYLENVFLKINQHLQSLYQEMHYQEDRFLVYPMDTKTTAAQKEMDHAKTLKEFSTKDFSSGSTACLVEIDNNQLTVASVGDSIAVLFYRKKRGSFKAVILTLDQKPQSTNCPDLVRMLSKQNNPNYKVKNIDGNYVNYIDENSKRRGLSMTSSIGDDNIYGCQVNTITYTIDPKEFNHYDFYLAVLTDFSNTGNSLRDLCVVFDQSDNIAENIIRFAYKHRSVDNALSIIQLLKGKDKLLIGAFDGHCGMLASTQVSTGYPYLYLKNAHKCLSKKSDPNPSSNNDSNVLEKKNDHNPSSNDNKPKGKNALNQAILQLSTILHKYHQCFFAITQKYGEIPWKKLSNSLFIDVALVESPCPEYKIAQEKMRLFNENIENFQLSINMLMISLKEGNFLEESLQYFAQIMCQQSSNLNGCITKLNHLEIIEKELDLYLQKSMIHLDSLQEGEKFLVKEKEKLMTLIKPFCKQLEDPPEKSKAKHLSSLTFDFNSGDNTSKEISTKSLPSSNIQQKPPHLRPSYHRSLVAGSPMKYHQPKRLKPSQFYS